MGMFDIFGDVFGGIKDIGGSIFGGIKDIGGGLFNGVLKPIGEKAWGLAQGALNRVDKLSNLGDKVIDGAGNVASGIGSLFNSSWILPIALAGVGVLVLPKIIDKYM